jgi:hypothetical protein
MTNFKNNDIYFRYISPFGIEQSTSRSIITNNNELTRNITQEIWLDKNIKKYHRPLIIYDYIIISNNNYNEVINNLNNNIRILVLENNIKDENNIKGEYKTIRQNEILINNNITVLFDKQLLSIEKYIYNDNIFCVFEEKIKLNYFSKNIIIGNNTIKTTVIMNNITETEKQERIKQQEILIEKDENKKEEDENKELANNTIKYYVRNYSDNCYNNFNIETFIFSTTPNGKSINKHLTLDKGTKYIFEMTSETCPFNVRSSNDFINFKSNSNKYLFKNVGSVLKGQTIEFYIPETFNKSIFYFGYMNTKKLKAFKINTRNTYLNMHLTYN